MLVGFAICRCFGLDLSFVGFCWLGFLLITYVFCLRVVLGLVVVGWGCFVGESCGRFAGSFVFSVIYDVKFCLCCRVLRR